jgi:hypothetical protein
MRKRVRAPARVQAAYSEREARQLGWNPASEITWREFLEQYPYRAAEIRHEAERFTHAA